MTGADRDGRARRRAALLALPLLVLFSACGGSESTTSRSVLPADPNEWICPEPEPVTQSEIDAWCAAHPNRGTPIPDALRDPPPPSDFKRYEAYNERLKQFMVTGEYYLHGWVHDEKWRFSGPSVVPPDDFGHNYGPHFPLRIHYSPEVVDWLCNGRQGDLPDGAMMIKEMTLIFGILDITVADDGCMDIADLTKPIGDPPIQLPVFPVLWAPMLKWRQASHDGWVWTLQQPDIPVFPTPTPSAFGAASSAPVSTTIPPQFPPPLLSASAFTGGTFTTPITDDPAWYPTGGVLQQAAKIPNVVMLIPLAGEAYCLSCHATAVSESTFASMDNILGKELRYKAFTDPTPPLPTPTPVSFSPFPKPLAEPPPDFAEYFDQLAPVSFADVWETRMPAETYDQQVTAAHGGPGQFLTAAQCNACHNATPQSPLMPNMALVEDPTADWSALRNLSPYGEWRVSPMGLAGRDPIFFSQLQGETNNLAALTACIENTCLRCHGVMGARQFASDTQGQEDPACADMTVIAPPPEVPSGKPFRRAALQQWPGSTPTDLQFYGALGRDGISCTVCHHISAQNFGAENSYTGNFITGPADEIYGPYQDDTIVTKPMEHALGIMPMFAEQISSSELCGSCHNILLPIFDNDGRRVGAGYEQSTHFEWLNSETGRPGPQFRSCQDCHMPTHYDGRELAFKIANSESNDDFPPTTNRLPDADITLTERRKFSRHSLHGLNVFLNQFFQQFPLILGFQQVDWMSEQPSPVDPPALPFASGYLMELPLFNGFDSMLAMAENDTATVEIGRPQLRDGQLRTQVTVRNLTGHYLPSGVGFRRMFLEFLVQDRDGTTLWASGRTNELGFIVDGLSERVLESEQPVRFPAAPVQPHYQVIDAENQVQIYQELIRDSAGILTTSFLRRVHPVKDNRIRPKGFDPEFFALSPSPYIQELAELPGDEASDPYYVDPQLTGADQIEYNVALDADTLQRAEQVQVTLYYQSIPPFYLQERFQDASRGPAHKDDIQRLHYLTSHLNLDAVRDESDEPVLKQWKLRITTAARQFLPP